MARRRGSEYPRWIYGPYGAAMIISRAEDWLAGWTALPDNAGAESPPVKPMHIPYSRGEMKKMLRASHVSFDESAADVALYMQLPE